MFTSKFLNSVASILMIASLLLGGAIPVRAQGQDALPSGVTKTQINAAPPDPSKNPHYFGPFPNWANSPQVLTNAVVTISPAAPVPGSVGNALVDRAFATDFEPPLPVTPASVSAVSTSAFNATIGSATGGNFTLTVDAATTAAIAWNALAADVQSALSTAGVTATVTGAGSIASPWVISFSVAPTTVTINGAGLTQAVTGAGVSPAATVTYNANIGSAVGGSFTLTVDAATTAAIAWNALAADVQSALSLAGVTATVTGSGTVASPWVITFSVAPTTVTMNGAGLTQPVTDSAASGASNIYNVTIGSATGGNFTLTVDAATTTAITWNALAADVQSALSVAGVTATVTGSGPIADPWVITFSVAPTTVTMDGAGLTKAVTDANVAPTAADIYNATVGSATGGNFTLTVDAATTAAIAWNALAADVQSALSAAGVTATVTGSGTVANPWVVTFSVAPTTVTMDGAGLTKAVTNANVAPTASNIYNATIGSAAGGSFTLTIDAATTAAIAWNALAADVQSALSAAGVTATVTGSGSIADPWVITFSVAPSTVTIDSANLTQPIVPVPAFVVVPSALPTGILQAFQTWNQATTGGSPTPSAGGTFHAYVLQPVTGTTDQYLVVFDSGALTVPPLTAPGVGEIVTYPVANITITSGNVIAFYGEGIPSDTGAGADIVSYPAPNPPVQGSTITVGDPATFPLLGQARTYSIAATVLPTSPGAGAEAVATVNPQTGAITAVTVTVPGSGYTSNPNVAITAPGMTLANPATATADISAGAISSITVDLPGFGFTAPAVSIDGGNPTTPATAVASGGVDDIVTIVDGGSGYAIQPIVEFSLPNLPGGIQATGTATMDANGVVNSVTVTAPGSGYTSAPTITIWDGSPSQPPVGTSATVTATISIGQVDVTAGGAGYTAVPTVTITDTVGAPDKGASATAVGAVFGAVTAINLVNPGAGYLTPGIRKFVDELPGLCDPATGSGCSADKYIPLGVPDTETYPGSDYYEIAVVQYRMQFHSELPPTLLRGYVQLDTAVIPGAGVDLSNAMLNGPDVPIAVYKGVTAPHYLGPTIVATKDKPVRILFRNLLPTGSGGNLFLPVDTTLMGSGPGPDMMTLDANGVPIDMVMDAGTVADEVRNPACGELNPGTGEKPMGCFADNRATLHLHGGITPWISDGTPHQWITPAGENTAYPEGVSVKNVPDMNVCAADDDGCMTFFYTNQQSARLLFYHDHAWGITRLNVYAGEAAGYLITDQTEQNLFGAGKPFADLGIGTPLIVQDKTFVPSDAQMALQDPTWQKDRWGGEGSLWVPHVYMPAQNPGDPSGMSSFGRWMYGPFFWPPTDAKYQPIANPYYDPACDPNVVEFCEPPTIPGTPNISVGMEAFNDTPLVNGTVYPKTTVDPKAYRFRILNAANDRFWNLSWYVADPRTGTLSEVALNPVELEAAQTDPVIFPTPDTFWSPAGPNWIQIGTEGGFLPAPVVVPAHPTTWITDPTRFDVGNVDQHSLLLAPAERADVIVDFSQFRGKTLILYNDAPAAFPARVPGYDYYTGGPDLSPAGAPTTLPGYGPNTRTIMKVTVSSMAPSIAFDRPNTSNDRLGALEAAFAHHADGSGVFESGQNPIVVGQEPYNSAYGTNFAASGWCNSPTNPAPNCDGYARISEQGGDEFKFDTLFGTKLAIPLEPKGIHDEMNSANFDEFGRMSANIGLEAPGATPLLQNIILYPYTNPATEILNSTGMPSSLDVTPISSAVDGTQIWKITHNGVDTHPIHFHLYDIQLLNRVAWDNIISPPDPNELGWKDTIRVNPLQDTYVAIRPIVPVLPFAVPDSERVLNPMMPLGARGAQNGVNGNEAGFNNTDANGNPIAPIINNVTNFGWEYVWHCHILSHEEMDMMRPVSVFVPRALANAPVLSLTGLAGSPVNLTWTDGTPVDYNLPASLANNWGNQKSEIGYRIERSVDGGVTFDPLATVIANATSFTDNTTVAGTTYQYHVIAFNAAGDSISNVVAAETPPVVSSITRASADPTSAASVDFTVTFSAPVTGVDAADFSLAATGTLAGASVTTVNGSGAVYTVSVNTGTGFGTLRMDLIDNDSILSLFGTPLGGAGLVNGDFITGETYTVRPPGAFNKSLPTNGSGGQATNQIISWSSSANAISYQYCIDTTNNDACDGTWVNTGTTQSATPPGLVNGATYYWQVQAINDAGTTDANAGVWWSYSTRTGNFTKSAPANGATGVALNSWLSWSTSAGATSYEYCIDTSNNNTCDGTWTSTGTTRSVQPGLASGTTYYWQVRSAYAGSYIYANSINTWWSFTTSNTLPGAFNKTTPTNNAIGQATNQALSWNASTNTTSYQYCIDTTNNNTCDGTWVNTGTTRTVTPPGLVNGATYYWQVQAVNGAGTTDANAGAWWSYSTRTGNFTKSAPANGATGIALSRWLSWSTSLGAASYEYCIDTSNNNTCNGTWTSTGTIRSVLLTLNRGTTYYWQVRSVYAGSYTYGNNPAWWSFTTIP